MRRVLTIMATCLLGYACTPVAPLTSTSATETGVAEPGLAELAPRLRDARASGDARALTDLAVAGTRLGSRPVGREAEPRLALPEGPVAGLGDPRALLAEARRLDPAADHASRTDPVPTLRGSMAGLSRSLHRLTTGQSAVFRIRFRAGEPALALVEASPAARLQFEVRDRAGAILCRDRMIEGVAFCRWSPAETAEFRLTLVNPGESVDFALITN
jgi:hypothetical protein